jgi:hypothetical protein
VYAYDYAGQDPIDKYDLAGTCLGIPNSGACPGQDAVVAAYHYANHAIESVSYGLYYWAHRDESRDTPALPKSWDRFLESIGLAGDRYLDRQAGTGDRDEGRLAHYIPYIPGIGYIGPKFRAPGVHKNGKVDK